MDHSRVREILLARMAELEALDAGSAEARGPVELDQSSVGRLSRMDALQGQAMASASSARRRQALRRLRLALDRLESDAYGRCLECDAVIPDGRLEIDPAAELCVACAS